MAADRPPGKSPRQGHHDDFYALGSHASRVFQLSWPPWVSARQSRHTANLPVLGCDQLASRVVLPWKLGSWAAQGLCDIEVSSPGGHSSSATRVVPCVGGKLQKHGAAFSALLWPAERLARMDLDWWTESTSVCAMFLLGPHVSKEDSALGLQCVHSRPGYTVGVHALSDGLLLGISGVGRYLHPGSRSSVGGEFFLTGTQSNFACERIILHVHMVPGPLVSPTAVSVGCRHDWKRLKGQDAWENALSCTLNAYGRTATNYSCIVTPQLTLAATLIYELGSDESDLMLGGRYAQSSATEWRAMSNGKVAIVHAKSSAFPVGIASLSMSLPLTVREWPRMALSMEMEMGTSG